MAKGRFNWKLLLVALISIAVLGVTAAGLRQWNKKRLGLTSLRDGKSAYEQGRWHDAASNLGTYIALSRNKADADIYLKYADAQMNIRPLAKSNVQQAISTYSTVLRMTQYDSVAFEKLVELYFQIGVYGEAELVIRNYMQKAPKPKTQRMLAASLAGQRKFKDAAELLNTVINSNPNDVESYEMLAVLIRQRPQDFNAPADEIINLAVEKNPDSAKAYMVRASYYIRNGNTSKALKDLQSAAGLNLSEPHTRLRLAQELINVGDFNDAQKHLDILQQTQPQKQGLWETSAKLALDSKANDLMVKVAEDGLKALSLQPWDFMPIAAELCIAAGNFDKAADYINKLEQKDILPGKVLFLRGLLAVRQSRNSEAIKFFRQAGKSGEHNEKTYLILASLLADSGDALSAITELRSLTYEKNDSFEGNITLAKILFQSGRLNEAIKYAEKAKQILPTNTQAELLSLQINVQLLTKQGLSADSLAYKEMERRLAILEKAGLVLNARLLRFELAIASNQMPLAGEILAGLKKTFPVQLEVEMADVEYLEAQKDTAGTIAKLTEIVRQFPNDTWPLRKLASVLEQQQNWPESEKLLKESMRRFSDAKTGRELSFMLAELYNSHGQKDEAYKLLEDMAAKYPDSVSIKQQLLTYDQLLSSPAKAQKVVDEIELIIGKDSRQWRYEQSKVWFLSTEFDKYSPQIISMLKENVSACPEDYQSLLLLARMYEKTGNLPLAISIYQEILIKLPDNIEIIASVVPLLLELKRYNEADGIIESAIADNPYNADLLKLKLQVQLKSGRIEKTEEIFRQLAILEPQKTPVKLMMALIDIRDKKYEQADKILDELSTKEPNSLPVGVVKVELAFKKGETQQALELCDELVKSHHNAPAYLTRARINALLRLNEKAENDFKSAAELEPDNLKCWLLAGEYYRSVNATSKSIECMRKAAAIEPNDSLVKENLITALLSSEIDNINAEGRKLLDAELQARPENDQLNILKARLLISRPNKSSLQQAEKILTKINERYPQNVQGWLLAAETCFIRGNFSDALTIAMKGLAQIPNDKQLLLVKARAEVMWSPALAIPTIDVLINDNSNDTATMVFAANTLIAAGEPNKAMEIFDQQMKICLPKDKGQIATGRAEAIYKSGDKVGAKREFESLCDFYPQQIKAVLSVYIKLLGQDKLWTDLEDAVNNWLRLYSDNVDVLLSLAQDCQKTAGSEGRMIAERLFGKILDIYPDNSKAMLSLAVILQSSGKIEDAAVMYRKVLKMEPDNVVAINNLAWIICEYQRNFMQALELADSGLKKMPDYTDLIDTRGIIYYRQGKYQKAVEDFSKCLELYFDNEPAAVSAKFHLARAQANLGQRNDAKTNLQSALEMNTKIGGLSLTDVNEAQLLLGKL